MILCNIGHTFDYETEKLCRLFLPFEKIEITHEPADAPALAETVLLSDRVEAKLVLAGQTQRETLPLAGTGEKETELQVATALFRCFVRMTGYAPKWGLLTGVRPGKLYARLCREQGREAARTYFRSSLFVSDEKIALCESGHEREETVISLSRPDSFSLYISVPFCPSRCAYCSFVSHSVEKARSLMEPYVENLCRELTVTARYAAENGLHLETVYMGGGTPTTLSAAQLRRVLSTVKERFDCSALREMTVEAGRPDTITPDKLRALTDVGVDRISINPQTMSDAVLETIGRRHTAEQTRQAFRLARSMGFANINMDLIAGLPGDTPQQFRSTLDEVIAMDPESVTVHALSMKRASALTGAGAFPEVSMGRMADEMVSYARQTLAEHGTDPYYMYRQSKTVGNLENVGYAKPGYACLYNVYIMDETHTILGCGCGAVTKLKQPDGPYIERIFNFKYPYEYINRFDELLERKAGITDFYQRYSNIAGGNRNGI